MTELILCEKPSAAEKIANALSDKKPEKKVSNKISYYSLEHNKKKILVVSAVGHLYTVAEKEKKAWDYPIFNLEWKPSFEVSKESAFTKPYLELIKKLSKESDTFTVATDYDIEGEVIGLNIIRYACNKTDAKRMKYSTLTKEELIDSYENASNHLDWGQANAGLTRHELDWYYGINLSRALTLAIKNNTNTFKIMSTGRVQGPSLAILAKREKEIQKFVPEPFWQLELQCKSKSKKISAWHKEDKFWKKEKAEEILKKTKGKKAFVSSIKRTEIKQLPPPPFDLTALQIEAYRTLRISPKETLSLAQNLYINTYISYPRTSSNQLPPSLNYKKIITSISKQATYKPICDSLLKKSDLKPNNGTKKDPAHPAIYPTGEIPKSLKDKEAKLYDLIVRRTLASFGEYAKKETVTIDIDVNEEIFVTKGSIVTKPGWYEIYGKYAPVKEEEIPDIKEKEELDVKSILMHEKETQPPKRYTPASIIKELEKKNLGTKATRAAIIDSLYNRDYLQGKSVEVTELGLKTYDTLKKYCPEILDEELTRDFEVEMEEIREDKKTPDQILSKAKIVLKQILNHFKENELKIGKSLASAYVETRDQSNTIGKCDKCGKDLRIMYSPRFKSYFVACSGYPACKNTFHIPKGLPKKTDKVCPICGYPMVRMIRKGARPYDYCINMVCPKKVEWRKQQEEKKKNGAV